MKNWHERLNELDERLARWNEGYSRACEAALAARRRSFLARLRPPREGELREVAREAAAKVGPGPHDEVAAFFDELCDAFVEAPIAERSKMRAAIGASRALLEPLWQYAARSADLVAGPDAAVRLRRGVSAVAIDDARADIEDVRSVLGRLWIAGQRAGLDAAAVFAAVAAVANRGAGGGGAHMREILYDFERSPYFASRVVPELVG